MQQKVLEEFWIALSENIVMLSLVPTYPLLQSVTSSPFLSPEKMMAIISSSYSIIFGNPKAFVPRWFSFKSPDYFSPYKWNYLYDIEPLKNTLNHFIDFQYLKKRNTHDSGGFPSRLIITSTDVQKGEPVIFDNNNMDIDVESIAACVGYPFYGIQWTRKDSHYLWDGSLLTNTPMLEAIKRSPEHRKSFYIVDVFPRIQNELPSNMIEVWHRARDIIFMDKTDTNIEMLKIRERYLTTLKKMHSIINSKEAKVDEKTRKRLNELESEYNELVQSHGAVIDKVTRISRTESVLHFLLEDTDFSYHRVKKLIREGEEDAENAIAAKKKEGTIEK